MSQLVGLLLLFTLALGRDQAAAPAAPSHSPGVAELDRAMVSAETALRTGDGPAAERLYRDALVEGWTILGAVALVDGNEGEAKAAFSHAAAERDARLAPRRDPALATMTPAERRVLGRKVTEALARACFNLGVLLVQSGQLTPAIARLETAASLQPDFPRLQYSLGVAYFNAGRYDRALASLRHARQEAPKDDQIRRMLALAAFNTDAYAEAAALLEADSDRLAQPALQYAYGVALVRSDRAGEAERIFGELLATHGDSGEVNVVLGLAQAQQGDLDRAIASLQRAVTIQADVREAHAALGTIYLKQGRLAEAESALRAELTAHPDDLRARQTLATVLDLTGQEREAIAVLRSLIAAKPDDADARYLVGKILLKEGAGAEAIVELEHAARLAPSDPNIHYQLGQAYQRTGRTEQATAQFDLFRQLKDERRAVPR